MSRYRSHAGAMANDLRQDAQDSVQSVKDAVYSTADDLRRNAEERICQASDWAGDYLDAGRERAVQLERTVETQIRRQPLQSMLIAAGVGFLVGAVLLRR